MKVLISSVKHLDELLGAIFMVCFVCLTILNVFLRYFIGFVYPWAEEIILLSFLWCVLIGAITGFRNDTHVAIDVLYNRFPEWLKKFMDIFLDVLILGFNIYCTYLSYIIITFSGKQATNILRIPYGYVYASMLICFGAMSIFGAVRLVLRATGKYVQYERKGLVDEEELKSVFVGNGKEE